LEKFIGRLRINCSDSGRGNCFSPRQNVREILGSTSSPYLLLQGALSTGIMRSVVKPTTPLQVVHSLRMSGAIPSFHHTHSCLAKGQFCFTLLGQSVFKSMKFFDNSGFQSTWLQYTRKVIIVRHIIKLRTLRGDAHKKESVKVSLHVPRFLTSTSQ
jgi:hypothetical protein